MTKTTGRDKLRLRKRELFRQIGYEPHAGQTLVHRSKASRRILVCGVRWGKSTCGAMEAVAALLEPRKSSVGWIVSPSYYQSELMFERVCHTMQVHFRHRIVDLQQRDQRIVITNCAGGTSTLRGRTADNPVSLLSEGLDWLIVDEVSRIKQSIWTSYLSPRLVDKQGWALLLSTPGKRDWFHKLFRRGEKGEPGYESWCSPSWTNPHLDPAAIEAEKAVLAAEDFDREYGAQFIGPDLEPCELCNGPADVITPIITVNDDEELPLCPVCNHEVDKQGKTICGRMPDGKPSLMVIRLQLRRPDVVPQLPCADDFAQRMEAQPPIGGVSESPSDSAN